MKKKGLAPVEKTEVLEDEFFGNLDATKIFTAEFEQFEQAEKRIAELTDDLMTEFKAVANNKFKYRDALKFMADMGRNIVSLHDSRRQLIKERVNIKKTVVDQILKKQKVDDESGNTDSDKFMDAVYTLIKNERFGKKPSDKVIESIEKISTDSSEIIIEHKTENLYEDEGELSDDSFGEPQLEVNIVLNFLQYIVDNDISLVLDEDYNFYFVNEEFEEIESAVVDEIDEMFQFKSVLYPMITFNIESEKFEIVDSEGDIYEFDLAEFE